MVHIHDVLRCRVHSEAICLLASDQKFVVFFQRHHDMFNQISSESHEIC